MIATVVYFSLLSPIRIGGGTTPRAIGALFDILLTSIIRIARVIRPQRTQLNTTWTLPTRIRTR